MPFQFGPSVLPDHFADHVALPCSVKYTMRNEAQTQWLAEQLALAMTAHWQSAILPGMAPIRIYLSGDLGAGKTTFARAFLRTLGVSGRIKSPTYAILEPYELELQAKSRLNLYHFDFYRFGSASEWEDAGFRELFDESAIILAEWPEKVARALPSPDLWLVLENDENADVRHLSAYCAANFDATTNTWLTSWLNTLQAPSTKD